MRLIKDIYINKYRVLADYKVKVAKSPFMSVLQLANEEGGLLTPEILYEQLMKPLSVKACENLLIRLASMKYFKEDFNGYIENDEEEWLEDKGPVYYELTDFGKQSMKTKDFYDKRNGLLEIWVAEDNEFTSKIIKVIELPYDEDSKLETENLNNELTDLISSSELIKLKDDAFTIDKIMSQIKFLESDKEILTITLETKHYTVSLVDFFKDERIEKQTIIKSILQEEFQGGYLPKENIILTDFDAQNLSLIRSHKIEEPFYRDTYFNSISIPNIPVSPKTIKESREWFEALLKQRVNEYFLSDEEYDAFENKIANEFQLFKKDLINTINRQQLINVFGEEDLYKKSKLETIDYLNY